MSVDDIIFSKVRRRKPTDIVMDRTDFLQPGEHFIRIEDGEVIIVQDQEDAQFKIFVGKATNPVFRNDVLDMHKCRG